MNPTWGSPHIVGELGKLGIAVAKSTVEEIHGKSKQTTESDMAKLFKESYKGFSIYRLHRCTDGTIHDALCFGISLS
jgi:hypothetical protein